MRKSLAILAGAAALTLPFNGAWAQEKVIKFGFAQDFTKVYTFVSSEDSHGQRDYLSLINARGGIKGYTFQATVVDHGNEPQRGIEAYERFKADGVVLMDFFSTPMSRARVPRAKSHRRSSQRAPCTGRRPPSFSSTSPTRKRVT